jgi:hypothetical protein
MTNEKERAPGPRSQRFLGSLRDALAAASREDPTKAPATAEAKTPPDSDPKTEETVLMKTQHVPSAAEAAREARGGTPNIPPADRHVEFEAPPTTKVVRQAGSSGSVPSRTQIVRGKQKVERGAFHQDPVVGWLVVVGGPGLGSYRPIFEGNNTIGRAANQHIPIDFGDDAISSEEQAYIRYDSSERGFLFVPNLAKTNVVSVNDKRPTGAVVLNAMDVIAMGRTQLVFVPFCGPDFDWSEIVDGKG